MLSSDIDVSNVSRRRLTQHTILTSAQEVVLAKRIEKGDKAAKKELVKHNTRLVVSIAWTYPHGPGRHFELDDLVSEGIMGLNRAAEKFDWRKGFKFSTYATWWIRQTISRAISDKARTIRVPVHVVEKVNRMCRVREDLAKEMGCEPSKADIAERLGFSVKEVESLMSVDRRSRPSSIDAFEEDVEDGGRPGLIPSTDRDLVESEACKSVMMAHVQAIVSRLPEREAFVITRRFDLDGKGAGTLEGIGKELGVTREWVRQIEAFVLMKLRTSYGAELRGYLEEGGPEFPSLPGAEVSAPPPSMKRAIKAKKPRLVLVPPPSDLPEAGSREWYLERLRGMAVRLGRPPTYLDLMKAEGGDGFPVSELYGFWESITAALAEAGVVEAQEVEVA